jgi:hypothetical protein
MVGSNWFLPEKYRADGSGYPLVQTVTGGQFRDLPLYGCQPCAALIRDGESSWKTTLSGSGLFLFGLAPLPVTIVLPGQVEVTAEIALRPEEWRRGFAAGIGFNSLATDDLALWLRVRSGGVVFAEAWMEWVPRLDLYYFNESLQLACGWHGPDGLESVYAHLLPFEDGARFYIKSDIGFPNERSRSFGFGCTLNVPMHGLYTGPDAIEVMAQTPIDGDAEYFDQPCNHFTGHVVPLANTLDYMPDGLSAAERLEANPSGVFGVLDDPACGAVGNPQSELTLAETDQNTEWSYLCEPSGPLHLGSIFNYQYSDHAVVPGGGNEESNISPVHAENERLARLRVKWTYPKRFLFNSGSTYAPYLPVGDFVFESIGQSHGAWCEWATEGLDEISMSATTSVDQFGVELTGLAVTASICRHFTASPWMVDDPGEVETKDYFELRFAVLVSGLRTRDTGEPQLDYRDPEEWSFIGRVFLNDADVAKLFAGQTVTIAMPYTDGRGVTALYWPYGVLEIQAIGRE